VRQRIEVLVSETAADEPISLTLIHNQVTRHRSFEIIAEACNGMTVQRQVSQATIGRQKLVLRS